MKHWWLQQSLRDRQIMLLGSLLLIIIMLYELTLAPLQHAVGRLDQRIQQDQALLAWMQQADQQLSAIGSEASTKPVSESLLSFLQTSLADAELDKAIVNLQQVEKNNVQIRLRQVSFDSFANWLMQLANHGITIQSLVVTPIINKVGMVDVELECE